MEVINSPTADGETGSGPDTWRNSDCSATAGIGRQNAGGALMIRSTFGVTVPGDLRDQDLRAGSETEHRSRNTVYDESTDCCESALVVARLFGMTIHPRVPCDRSISASSLEPSLLMERPRCRRWIGGNPEAATPPSSTVPSGSSTAPSSLPPNRVRIPRSGRRIAAPPPGALGLIAPPGPAAPQCTWKGIPHAVRRATPRGRRVGLESEFNRQNGVQQSDEPGEEGEAGAPPAAATGRSSVGGWPPGPLSPARRGSQPILMTRAPRTGLRGHGHVSNSVRSLKTPRRTAPRHLVARVHLSCHHLKSRLRRAGDGGAGLSPPEPGSTNLLRNPVTVFSCSTTWRARKWTTGLR